MGYSFEIKTNSLYPDLVGRVLPANKVRLPAQAGDIEALGSVVDVAFRPWISSIHV